MKKINQEFAKTLKKIRVERGLTQEKLAELSDINYKYFQKLESKNPSSPTMAIVERLVMALDISFSEFFKDIKTEKEKNNIKNG